MFPANEKKLSEMTNESVTVQPRTFNHKNWYHSNKKMYDHSNKNRYERQGNGFHYDNMAYANHVSVPLSPGAENADVRILYNPNPEPVAGTVLVLKHPSREDMNFLKNRLLHLTKDPKKDITLNRLHHISKPTNRPTNSQSSSSIFAPMLPPGWSLYFDSRRTLHGFPYRTQPVRIYRTKKTITKDNLKKASVQPRARTKASVKQAGFDHWKAKK